MDAGLSRLPPPTPAGVACAARSQPRTLYAGCRGQPTTAARLINQATWHAVCQHSSGGRFTGNVVKGNRNSCKCSVARRSGGAHKDENAGEVLSSSQSNGAAAQRHATEQTAPIRHPTNMDSIVFAVLSAAYASLAATIILCLPDIACQPAAVPFSAQACLFGCLSAAFIRTAAITAFLLQGSQQQQLGSWRYQRLNLVLVASSVLMLFIQVRDAPGHGIFDPVDSFASECKACLF